MNTIMAGIISLFLLQTPAQIVVPTPAVVAETNYSLTNRYGNTFVNDVFSDNILLTLAYMGGTLTKGEEVDWEAVRAPQTTRLVLKPGETFAFHDRVLPEYKDKIAATTNAHFNSSEGFRSDGWLVGDGVCHLASFMYVTALEAGLTTVALTRHDFAKIADVPREYGVSIYSDPDGGRGTATQNLYITNNRDKTIAFVFRHENNALDIQVEEMVL